MHSRQFPKCMELSDVTMYIILRFVSILVSKPSALFFFRKLLQECNGADFICSPNKLRADLTRPSVGPYFQYVKHDLMRSVWPKGTETVSQVLRHCYVITNWTGGGKNQDIPRTKNLEPHVGHPRTTQLDEKVSSSQGPSQGLT